MNNATLTKWMPISYLDREEGPDPLRFPGLYDDTDDQDDDLDSLDQDAIR